MTKKYSTKKALVASVLALVLCFSMLLGTTYAWFTDSVTSSGNIIKTGTLEVEMHWAMGTENPDSATWIDASTGAIFNYDNWEPGYVEVRHIKIANVGSLPLKYQVNIVANGEISDLTDVIDVYYVDPAVQISGRTDLTDANKLGTLTEVLAALGQSGSGILAAGDNDTITIALKMQEEAGNEYQDKSIGASFSIQLLATQAATTADDIDDQYDADATYEVLVNNAADLQLAIDNAKPGTAIVVESDIELSAPIVIPASANTYSLRSAAPTVVIDLNGKTINTAYAEGSTTNHVYAFTNNGNLLLKNGTINARGIFNYGNLTIENVTINAIDGNGGYAVRNYAGSTFTMNSGKLATTLEDDHLSGNGGYDATTLRVDSGASAVINSGIIENICDFTNAVENYGTVVINDATITAIHTAISNKGTMTINGGSVSCGMDGTTRHTIYSTAGMVTINGGSFVNTSADQNSTGASVINGAVTINGGTFEGRIENYYANPVIKGGEFSVQPQAKFIFKGYECTQNAEGKWVLTIGALHVTEGADLAYALPGHTIYIDSDITLSEEVTLPADVTLVGSGKQINGTIYAGGNLTIEGHVKVTAFSASYYNRVITIGPGACFEVTGNGRVSIAYGNVFNITGTIENAKTADKSSIQPSLIVPGGLSITGGSDATMNITNAYVKIGSTSSKNSSANGTFTFNFENSIVECTNQFTLAEPTSGKNPTFVMNIKDSVVTTATKFIIAAPNSTVVLDNSTLTTGTYFRNSGELTVKNGSVLTGATIQFGENGGNDGTTIVDNSTFTINASAAGHALDGKGTGSIIAKNGATVSVTYYKDMVVDCDETSTFTGTEVN